VFERLGRYQLSREVASGDLASIHRAYLATPAGAVKALTVRRILPAYSGRADVVELLQEEARLRTQLEHPNILALHDADQQNGQWFLVEERVVGQDLGAVLRRARQRGVRIDLQTTIYFLLRMLDALAHIHARTDVEGNALGIVHRDVCPASVLIGYDGEIKLSGFSFAKYRGRPSPPPPGFLHPRYNYVSPEQALGNEIDHRSDVYSAALIAWEMISGTAAYDSKTDLESLARAQRGHVRPLGEVAPLAGTEIQESIDRALSFAKQGRPASAAAFRDELARILYLRDPTFSGDRVTSLMVQLFSEEIVAESGHERAERLALQGPQAAKVSTAQIPAPVTRPLPPIVPPVSQVAPAPQPIARPVSPLANDLLSSPMKAIVAAPVTPLPMAPLAPPPAPAPAEPAFAPIVPPRAPRRERSFPIGKIILAVLFLGIAGLTAFAFSSDRNNRLVTRKMRAAFIGRQPGGNLTIESVPPGARVAIDDEDTGKKTPMTVENFESGVIHDVVLTLDDGDTVSSTVSIKPGSKGTITVMFKNAVVPLTIKSDPPGAEVYVDGRMVALAPASLMALVGKETTIRLVRSGFIEHIQKLVPERGQPVNVDIKMEKTKELLEAEAAEAEAIKAAEEEAAAEVEEAAPKKKKRR
jgi:serine/threonine protein kinase